MLTCDTLAERLDDYLDDELSEPERAACQEHLAACELCRDEERATRALLLRARDLQLELAPPRDLWPDIATRLEPRDGLLAFSPRWRRRLAPALALAAAAALLAVLQLPPSPSPGSQVGPGETSARPIAVASVLEPGALGAAQDDYERATRQLLDAFKTQRGAMAPETQAVLERNLATIDQALGEIRGALQQDPENAQLTRLLNTTHRRRLVVLQQAVRTARATRS